jgi:hypothetical protein
MWRYGAVLLVIVAALALIVSGCGKKTPPEGTGAVAPPEPSTTTTIATAITYQCPMHEDVTSDTPGRCTEEGCEMFLTAQAPEGAEVEYFCSMPDMHPDEQVSDTPGKCPECGMFMAARIVEDVEDEDTEEDEDAE